jgi:chain length determinant protein EpsF
VSIKQYLRVIWARKWLALLLLVLASAAGITFSLRLPKWYVAGASLVVDVRPDPILGGLSTPANMATQVEILKSDKVATRVVTMLGMERAPAAVQQWREATGAKMPLDRYFADILQRGLTVEPLRGSNVITITFGSQDGAFAAAAANAFAQAAMDVAVEMRVEPARQSASWFDGQTKTLRSNLEQAQARLSKYQQEKGIVVSDERLDLENARLSALTAQLAAAQAESVEAFGRQRNTGSEMSPDVQQSGVVQGLKTQLASAETKLSEISSIVGANHPQRLQLEAQIAELKQQLAAEVRRVSGSTSVVSRASSQKVGELRAMAENQKRQLLSLRSERDQISVLARDVETAQRSYDAVSQRMGQLTMESQTNQSTLRLLSQAVEPSEPSKKKVIVGILGSLVGGLLLGAAVAIGLELLDRRVRGTEDLMVLYGVPVIGVLRPASSKQPIFRQLAGPRPVPNRPSLPMPGTQP